MSRRILVVLCLVFDFALVWIGYTYFLTKPLFSPPIRAVTPDDVGLLWEECELPVLASASSGPAAEESVACFDRPAPVLGHDEKNSRGQNVGDHTVQLTVGPDVYRARADDYGLLTYYSLEENGGQIHSLVEGGDAAMLFMSLQRVDNKVAWAIANETPATVIYDGQDLRDLYGLDKAHAPYGLAGKLIFMAQKGDKYFVMFDGAQVGPAYDNVTIGYCCETAMYSVRFGEGRYQFRGTRDGRDYIVEISEASGTPVGAGPRAMATPVDPNDPLRRDAETMSRSFIDNDHGTIQVLDRNGQVVARVGAEVRMSGGEVPWSPELEHQLREPLPKQCRGPYWVMGEVER